MSRLNEFLHGGAVDGAEIQRVRDTLLFEGPDKSRRTSRFYSLLILASAIATFGLLGNSVATVIGAMIVAPLMLPIMGLAFSVSLGDRRAILRSLTISLLGIGAAIAVGWVLTRGFASVIDPTTNPQVMSRTSPKMIDLAAALATGLAGAYATGRKDVSDTLPGVAIAISLVPPLANVGLLLATGNADLARGSMLLFVTNYLAILLTGALMFGIMGYPAAYHAERSRRAKATAITIAAVMGLVIVAPLAYTSLLSIATNFAESRSTDAVTQWLKGSDYRLASVDVSEGRVRVVIAGQGQVPMQQKLQDALRGRLFGMPVDLEIVPETRSTFETTGSGGP